MKHLTHNRKTGWKCKLISYLTNLSKHLERANKLYTQLALPPNLHTSFGRRDFQEDEVLNGKANIPTSLIYICPLPILSG